MNQHTFAVLVYQESPYLQACLDSLRHQTTPSEIILCTSTPSAFLKTITEKNHLPLLINPRREGIAGDWNFALGSATTRLVTLAHQDDVYFPEYTAEIMEAVRARPDAIIAFSDYNEIISRHRQDIVRSASLNFFIKKTILRMMFRGRCALTENKQGLLAFGNPIACPTVAYQRERIGDFRFDKAFGVNIDWKAWYDLSRREGSFVRIDKTLVSHRIHTASETSRGIAEDRRQQEDRKMFERFWPAIIAKPLSGIYGFSYRNNRP